MTPSQLIVGLLCFMIFTTLSASDVQQIRGDEVALRGIASNFESAWTKRDAKGLAALWTEDGDFQSPYDSFAKGRAEIEAFYR